jgi:urease beta subunit
MEQDWKRWFDGYASDWAGGELGAVANRYGPRFLNAKPGKSAVYDNDQGFIDWLDRVRGFHDDAGLEKVEVVTVREMPLGGHHHLVSVLWAVRFARQRSLRIQFEITYTVALEEDGPKILSIVSHEDQRVAMRRHSLLPD